MRPPAFGRSGLIEVFRRDDNGECSQPIRNGVAVERAEMRRVVRAGVGHEEEHDDRPEHQDERMLSQEGAAPLHARHVRAARLQCRLMRRLLAFAVAAFSATALIRAQEAKARTVWDGVYTDAQAQRAMATYDSVCSRCHTLSGQGKGALTGDAFWTAFTQKSVGDLLTFVKTNMPNGNGGSLPASTYNDLVALILKSNGFPAGDVDVSPESVAGIQIIP